VSWTKQNLATKRDNKGLYDEYKCSECGFKKRYYTLQIDSRCPKCVKKEETIYGLWTKRQGSKCHYCKSLLILCPKDGHPNSKYWNLQRTEKEKLLVCPRGCLKDGSKQLNKWNLEGPYRRRK